MKTQNDMIAEHLKEHGSINPMEALSLYGCFRLASRIHDLRSRGMKILANRVPFESKATGEKGTYCEYRLVKEV